MFKKFLEPTLLATALIAIVLASSGCKKEEKAPEAVTATTQTAAPAATAATAGATQFAFEDGIGGWKGNGSDVKVEPATDQKKSGSASLKISGTSQKPVWNFALSPAFNLEPGKKYKLTGSMFVDSWKSKDTKPFIKVGVNVDGKWATNANSNSYDLKKTKEWQQLEATFQAPAGGKIEGYVALEKGTHEPISGTVYLDDIKVELAQ